MYIYEEIYVNKKHKEYVLYILYKYEIAEAAVIKHKERLKFLCPSVSVAW